MVPIAHQYNPNAIEKEVMVFAADEALQKEATEAGAKLVGGEELIEEIKKGRVELVSVGLFGWGFLWASKLNVRLGKWHVRPKTYTVWHPVSRDIL